MDISGEREREREEGEISINFKIHVDTLTHTLIYIMRENKYISERFNKI